MGFNSWPLYSFKKTEASLRIREAVQYLPACRSNLAPQFYYLSYRVNLPRIGMINHSGWGQYGDVYEALWRRYNSIVAVKTLKQDVDLNLNDFLAEASIMKNLQHKNLVRLLGKFGRILSGFI
ncbi:unnamed protein product [Hymenolepis diminuta]|uniref:Non-specific protein-tyrosine kinase n=1 Tax=Hymenolepis diminuta TaxID=6216 RepID=A0A0R3SBJ8_HYMDI|nr:unnamed protein product [Hymenolepis diminuta]